ncbi:MAG TPA: glycosyltransferase family 39 protein, partial [Anaerolineales bacterium]
MKRSIYLVTLLAFLLRLGLGFGAYSLLPQVGYASKPQQAGYLFFDAYRRDKQAWELAQSSKPLLRAFDEKFSSDQYGGMLWISAFVYRYLSGGTQQPMLMVLLAALIGSLGVFFVYLTTKRLADEKTAMISASIFAFFPEAILLGASQMREPFLMTFIAMAFYGLTGWQAAGRKTAWLWMLFALAGMLLVSPGFVALTLVASAGWWYFSRPSAESGGRSKFPWQAAAVALGIFVLALVVLAASWDSLVAVKGGGLVGVLANWARGTARW